MMLGQLICLCGQFEMRAAMGQTSLSWDVRNVGDAEAAPEFADDVDELGDLGGVQRRYRLVHDQEAALAGKALAVCAICCLATVSLQTTARGSATTAHRFPSSIKSSQ